MNIKNVAVALVALIASSAAQAQQAVQWKVSEGGNGHWYQLRPQHPLWLEKQAEAESLGGYLATLTTPAEVNFVLSLPGFPCGANSSAAWIGLRKTATGWGWITGEPFSGTGWAGSQPCNCQEWAGLLICGTPWWGTGLADGDSPPCCAPYPSSVFEWSADCNGDGIVDYGQCRDGSLPDYNGNNIPDCCEDGTPCVVGSYPVQWRVEDGGNGHWYQSLPCPGCCFGSAVQSARIVGAHLATLTSAGEQARLISVIPVGQAAKLGGFRTPDSNQLSGWQWTTGEAFNPSLVSWADGNPGCCGPNEFWLYLQNTPGPETGLHDGVDCSPTGADMLLLEWSADCNNDGIVDIGQIYLQPELYADANSNGIPDICEVDPCPGDITGGGFVDAIDLSILLAFWGSTGGGEFDADVNNDGIVEGADLSIVLGGWGPCPN